MMSIIINSGKLMSCQPKMLSRLKRLLCTCSCAVGKNEVPFSMAIEYRKWGTRARVFSQTLAHGNSKNEIR